MNAYRRADSRVGNFILYHEYLYTRDALHSHRTVSAKLRSSATPRFNRPANSSARRRTRRRRFVAERLVPNYELTSDPQSHIYPRRQSPKDLTRRCGGAENRGERVADQRSFKDAWAAIVTE